MPFQIPTEEPTRVTAGDSWFWDRTYGDYPASDGWELRYYVRGPSGSHLDIEWGTHVTADGDGFEIRVPASATTDIAGDGYSLVGRVTKGDESHLVYRDQLVVQANPAREGGERSFAQKMLEAFQEATLSEDGLYRRVERGDRTYDYAIEEWERRLAHWKLMVELERNPDARVTHAAKFSG